MVATKKPSGWTRTPLAATLPVAESTTAIACAAGSIARTQTPPEVWCMPRKENGSPWRTSMIASTSESGRLSTFTLLNPGQDIEHTLQRNVDPARPIGQFVRGFVDRLFERKEGQHHARVLFAHRVCRATAHRLTISGAKTVDCPMPPSFGQLHHSRLRCRPRFGELPHRGDAGI